jgi:CheY-like chemotaxis protein
MNDFTEGNIMSKQPPNGSERISVILIEDSATEAYLTRKAFHKLGNVDVYGFETMRQARLAIQSGPCDFVIVDTTLPDGSGPELFAELRSVWKGPAVAVTGSTLGDDRAPLAKAAHDCNLALLYKDAEGWPKSVVTAMRDALDLDDSSPPTPTAVAMAAAANEPQEDHAHPPTPKTVYEWLAVKAITMLDRVLTREGLLGFLLTVLVLGGFGGIGYELHTFFRAAGTSLTTLAAQLEKANGMMDTAAERNARLVALMDRIARKLDKDSAE